MAIVWNALSMDTRRSLETLFLNATVASAVSSAQGGEVRVCDCGRRRLESGMAWMTLRLCAATLLAAGMNATAAPAAVDPFEFKAPPGWREERIPFPLGFAPQMKYRGFEELRFGPGMFRPASDTYWTYAFFWWLDGKQEFDEAALKRDLELYYRGLTRSVGSSRGFKFDLNRVTAEVTPVKAGEASGTTKTKGDYRRPRYTVKLRTYDVFATGKELELRGEISLRYFKDLKRTWVWINVSPMKSDDAVWKSLRAIRDSFKARE